MKTKEDTQYGNVLVLANAIQLGSNLVREVAGNEIADSVEGQPLSAVLHDTMAAKINSKLAQKGGA